MPTKKQTTAKESTPATSDEILSNGKASANGKTAKTTTKKTAAAKVTDAVADLTASLTNAVAPAKKQAAPKSASAKKPVAADDSATVTKVYGEIQVSGDTFFIHKGSVPEGQLQLVIDAGKQELLSRIPGYNGQFVTVIGRSLKKKKTDKVATFSLLNIASHDQIGHRAYELSHENPNAVEDNWFKAENELLS